MAPNHVMHCPKCGGPSYVIDSRGVGSDGAASIRRRRRCQTCGERWTTYEGSHTLISKAGAQRVIEEALAGMRRALDKLL